MRIHKASSINIVFMLNTFWPTCFSQGNDTTPAHPAMSLCEGDMFYYESTNSCYWKIQKQHYFNQTVEECQKKGGTVVMIHSRSESQWIVEKLSTAYGMFWLGLTYSVEKKKFFWMNGKELHGEDYSRWSNVEVPGEGEKTCVEVTGTDWALSRCDRQLEGICVIERVDMCLDKNGGCEQECTTLGTRNRSCTCDDSLYTARGTRCLARCEVGNGGCQHMCKNTVDHRKCLCKRGYDPVGTKCERNFQTRLIGAMISGLVFGTLGICLCLLCVSWALAGDDASAKGSSDKESIKKDSLDKSSIAKSSDTIEELGHDEDGEAEVDRVPDADDEKDMGVPGSDIF